MNTSPVSHDDIIRICGILEDIILMLEKEERDTVDGSIGKPLDFATMFVTTQAINQLNEARWLRDRLLLLLPEDRL